jgi:hypothetical protein
MNVFFMSLLPMVSGNLAAMLCKRQDVPLGSRRTKVSTTLNAKASKPVPDVEQAPSLLRQKPEQRVNGSEQPRNVRLRQA